MIANKTQLLDTYASQRQLNKYVAPQILRLGSIGSDACLAQNIATRNFEIWSNDN